MDELDSTENRRASEAELASHNREVMAARLAAKPAQEECNDCGEQLNEVRKLYHCARCVDCQWAFEKTLKLYRKL